MAKEIDNRIVEMEFKNKDFEKAIAVTMESLDELNKKLDSLNDINVKGFDELTKAANGVDFSKLTDSIDYVASRFSFIGLAATKIKDKIIDEFMSIAVAIPKAIDNSIDTVMGITKEKGSARALNIAQAKFQLSNLGIEWSKIKGSIDQAVNDTRFGMDEAAMAASQLVASGVKLGEEMDHALLGISGVAAMTNSEYADIAHIFTSIAGIGKVYTQQLNQIAGKGLNATAAIAEYMGITEAEVREILKDKDAFIDFQTFAEAMWYSYGEAAKKGNDLFTGALANAKAALGRIGEKFYTPFYEYARQVLVEIKPVINGINTALDPFFQNLDKVMSNTKDIIIDIIHRWDEGFTILGQNVNLKSSIEKLGVWVGDLLKGLSKTMSGEDGIISIVEDTLLNAFYNIFGVLKSIKKGFTDVFGTVSKNDVKEIVEHIHELSENLTLSEEDFEKLERIIRGIASAFDLMYKYGSVAYETVIKPIIGPVVGFALDQVTELLAKVGDLSTSINEKAGSRDSIFVKWSNAIEDLKFKLMQAKIAFENWVRVIEYNTGLDFSGMFEKLKTAVTSSVPDVIKLIGEGLVGAFTLLGGAIMMVITNVGEFIGVLTEDSKLKDYFETIKSQSKVLSWFQEKIDAIKASFSKWKNGEISFSQFLGLDKLKEKFAWLMPIIEKFKEHYRSIFEADSQGQIPEGGFIDTFMTSLKEQIKNLDYEEIWGAIGAGFLMWWRKKWLDIQTYVADSISSFVGVFDKLTEGINASLVKMQKETNADKILKIAAAIGILALSVVLLTKIDPAGLNQALGALAMISILLGAVIAVLGFVTKETKKIEKDTNTYDEDISLISNGKQKGGAKGNIFTKVFTQIGSRLTECKDTITETMHDLTGMPALILSFAASVALIVGSLRKLAMVGTAEGGAEALDKAGTTVMAVMAALFAIAVTMTIVLSEYSKNDDWDSTILTKLAALFLGMGVAIKLIANSLLLFALVPEDRMVQVMNAALMMGLLLAEMAALIIIMMNVTKECPDPNMLVKAGSVFVMMALAIGLLTLPLIAIGAAASLGANMLAATAIVTVLLAELFGVAVAFGMFFKDAPTASAAMLAGSSSMLIMAIALTALMVPLGVIAAIAAVDVGVLMDAVTVITILTVVMALLVVLFGAVGGATSGIGAAGMLAGAASMWIIAKALQALMIPLAAIAALSVSGQLEGALKGLAIGLGLLFGAAVLSIAVAPGLMTLVSVIDGLAAALLMIGAAALMAGKGFLDFVIAAGLVQAMSFDNLAVKIEEAAKGMIDGFHNALTGGQVKIKEGLVALVTMSCAVLVGSTGMIAEAVMVLITDVIVAIDKNAEVLGFHLGHALWDIVAYAITGVFGGAIDMIEKACGGKGEFSKFLMENLLPKKEAEEQGKGTLADIFGGIFGGAEKDIGDSAKTVGGNSVEKLQEGAEDQLDDPNAKNVLTAKAEGYFGDSLGNIDLAQYGEDAIGSFNTGTDNGFRMTNGQAGTAIDSGNNYVATLGNTITSSENLSFLKNAGVTVGDAVTSGTNGSFGIASPSKVAKQIGMYFNEGLMLGLNDTSELDSQAQKNAMSLVNSVYDVMDSNEMKDLTASIAGIGLFDDTDYQPTITPVLDLSDVNQGFSSLDSMFASQRSLALAGEAAYLNDSGRALSMEIQNGNSKDMNQNFGALGSKLDRLGDAILSRQIVLDSGELVGGLANPMDRTLGVRAIRAQRGGRR